MFTYDEICELSMLCKENELFNKYVKKFKRENESLLSKVTHELGNHLTLISSTAQLLEKRNPEVSYIKHWTQLRDDIENMKQLLSSLSKYRCKECLEYKETDLTELVDEIVESFQGLAVEKNVSIIMKEVPFEEELISYKCDPVKIRQVVVNLIKNALEAVCEQGKIWVHIVGKYFDDKTQKTYLKLEIGNNGSIIEEDTLKYIFEIYHSTKGENRGIGLPIVKQIIEAHRGKIEVASEIVDGEGKTVFSIYLPL